MAAFLMYDSRKREWNMLGTSFPAACIKIPYVILIWSVKLRRHNHEIVWISTSSKLMAKNDTPVTPDPCLG